MGNILTPASYKIITAGMRADFQKGISEADLVSAPLYTKVPSAGAENVYPFVEHSPGMREWMKGESRVMRNYAMRDFSVKNRKFEDTLGIDVEDIEDNQLGLLSYQMKNIVTSGKMLIDQLIFECFNNGFTTALTYDGNPWFYDSHTVGLSTVDNNLGQALSTTTYTTAYQRIRGFKVQPDKLSTARPLNPGGKYVLVVPPVLEMTGRQILFNERNNYGATNELRGTADLLVSSYLTSDTAWFLVNVGGAVKPLFLQERTPFTMVEKTPANSDEAYLYDRIIYAVKWRGAALATFPWLAVGSAGTST